jgi:pimeloyl-ACP methyl ester carboxylesterase
MNSPDAEPGYRALFKDQSEFRNEVTALFGLRLGPYRPVRSANRIACPWLVCICERDVVTPPQPAFAAAARAPNSEVRTYDVGHFDIYVGETFERAVADQVAFLERHLLAGARAKPAAALG